MFRHKPGKAWPALEVHNMVLSLLLREGLGCGLAGQGYGDPQTPQQETNLLTPRVLRVQQIRTHHQHDTFQIMPTSLVMGGSMATGMTAAKMQP